MSAAAGRLVAGLAGGFLIFVFFGLHNTAAGLRITFHTALNASSPGEILFWLGHALLLFPASCLLGYSVAPVLGPALARFWASLTALSRPERALGLVALFVLAAAVARVGRFLVLYDRPFTDDEYAVEFRDATPGLHLSTAPRTSPARRSRPSPPPTPS